MFSVSVKKPCDMLLSRTTDPNRCFSYFMWWKECTHTINVIDEMQKVMANLTHCYPAFKLIHVFPNLKFQILRSLRYLPKIDSFMIPQDSRLRRVTNVSHQDYISLLYQNSWLPPKQELAVVFTTPSQAEYQFGTKILQSDCSKQSPYC